MDLFRLWFGLPLQDLLRLLVPPALLLLATVLPGRGMARATAAGVAVTLPLLRPLQTPPHLTALWSALWLLVAWQVGIQGQGRAAQATKRTGAVESGAVGLLIGLALMFLMIASLARQDLEPLTGRRLVLGLVLIGLGVLHLMLRRHVRRAAIAFAAMGLGLQVLDGVARAAQIAGSAPPTAAVWVATAIAVALVIKLGRARERHAGGPWVSDAHDLHD